MEFGDPEYTELLQAVRENPKAITNLREENGKLLICPSFGYDYLHNDIQQWKLYVPNGLTSKLVKEAHDPPNSAHLGIRKTLEKLKRLYFWPKMSVDVRNYVLNCTICKEIKAVNYSTQPQMGAFREVDRPFQRLFIDFLGPYPSSKNGNTVIFIVVDQYSRFVFIEPMRQATTINVIKFLEKHIFNMFSVPEYIWCDNGKQFTAKLFKEFLDKFGVKLVFSPKYSPQGNISERVNRSLLASIRAYVAEDHREWDVHLQSIASALRNAIHDSTKFSPFFLVFGSHMVTHGSDYELLRTLKANNEIGITKSDRLNIAQEFVLKNLKEAYNRNCKTYNLRSKQRTFDVGQEVFVRNFAISDAGKRFVAKFAQKFIKAKILKQVGTVAYEIVDIKGKRLGIYHTKDIIV